MPNPPSSNPPSRILLIVAAAIIAVGFLARFLTRDDAPPAPEPAQPATPAEPAAQPERDTFEAASTPPRDSSLPFTPRRTRVRTADDAEASRPYDGEWRVMFAVGEPDEFNESGRVSFTQEDARRIHVGGDLGSLFGELILDGSRVSTEYNGPRTNTPIEGAFTPQNNELTLSGRVEGPGVDPPYDLFVRFERVSEEERAQEALFQQFENEVATIFEALRNYARDNEGAMPPTLHALVPRYIDDPAAIESNAEREVIYNPNGTPPVLGDVDRGEPHIDLSELDTPEKLIAREQELQLRFGAEFLTPIPALTVRYPDYDRTYEASAFRGVYTPSAERDQRSELVRISEADRNAVLRASCSNNLKQLGLTSKMFENESVDGRFPPGPYVLYPEYLPDPQLLTCPSVETGVISYEYVFPAANLEELAAVLYELTGEDLNSSAVQGRVPLMVETHLCAGGQGSNVLYVDGHTEFHTPESFEQQIAPFLEIQLH